MYFPAMSPIHCLVKRIFDIVFSLGGLLVLWPIGIVAAILVKMTSPGPVFFFQLRVGRAGELFRCIKFRTMVMGASAAGSVTAAGDSRITAVGSILRRLKLDEFPQLWNVLVGKMSFVGPRPDVPGYADRLSGSDRRILDLRPGITGPATLYFRYEEELLAAVDNPKEFNDQVVWPKKVSINRAYADNWSFWKDIGFILMTIFPALNRILKLTAPPPRTPECLP